ncbi:MAG: DNA methyltransferase [Candidatus Falkowbacteria bacterium]
MKYFFVLGTNTALSVAELAAAVDLKKVSLLATDFLIWETDTEINPEALMKRLGGVIKIGEIREEVAEGNEEKLLKSLTDLAKIKKYQSKEGKFNFGFSDYGKFQFNKQNLGLKLKKYFSEENISSRFVISREKTLSSVVVTQNKLIARGIEFILIKEEKKILIGETLSVQPFKDLSRRDYGRPARDDQSGMLPPKLAQIMINLAQVRNFDDVIIDPFCGSGTILSEAMLAGYKHLFGSDLSARAIDDTHKNISWIRELYDIKNVKLKILVKNVTNLSKFIKANLAEAVITEPFLGPQRGLIDFKTVARNLEDLYSLALKEFQIVLHSGGRVVMIWPMFYGQKPITPNYNGFKILNMIPEELRSSEFIKKHYRETIIYGRPGQKVYREIVVLEKL